jgi:GTP-binding protein
VLKYKNYVIIGRANVGKSSIFNFLIRKKEAVVKDEEGTTIDWRSKVIDNNIKLWDTPGSLSYRTMPIEPNLILFIVENNITNIDKKIYLELKKRDFNVIVIINKMDLVQFDEDYSFFERYLKISIKNGIGLSELKKLMNSDECMDPAINKNRRWAIIGKPNVGKSSLINLIVGQNLHLVSDVPGTTREFLPIEDEKAFLDTPGQRKRANFPNYDGIFGMIFVMEPNQERQDLRLIDLAVQRKRPFFVIINKIDLVSKEKLLEIEMKIKRFWDVDILRISCMQGNRMKIKELICRKIDKLENDHFCHISTPILNKWLEKMRKFEPKAKYITQISTAPPAFFIDHKLSKDKERMLRRRLIAEFNLNGITININCGRKQ